MLNTAVCPGAPGLRTWMVNQLVKCIATPETAVLTVRKLRALGGLRSSLCSATNSQWDPSRDVPLPGPQLPPL